MVVRKILAYLVAWLWCSFSIGGCTGFLFGPSLQHASQRRYTQVKHPSARHPSLLFASSYSGEAWNRNVAELRKYYEEHGDCNVPYTLKEYARLVGFLKHVRAGQGRLSNEQRAQLDEMHIIWKDVRQAKEHRKWEEMFQRIVAYKQKHGDAKVTIKWPQDPELGKWVMHQRAKYKKHTLSEDRIAKLNSIGFVWVLRTRASKETLSDKLRWLRRLGELIEFYEENENFNVPRKGQTNALGEWVNKQKKKYRKEDILQYRVDLLEDMQFPWTNQPQQYANWLDQFSTYKEAKAQGSALSKRSRDWANLQRTLNEKDDLDPERKAMLDGIGFDWNPRNSYKPGVVSAADKRWHQRYQELIEFHKENGHFRVPPHQKQLYGWVSNQRQRKKTLSKERVQLLDTIGFPWSAKAELEQDTGASSAASAAIKG